ncbi:nucleolar protein 14, partial [Phenoliferia sp. Uapishka_3]
MGGSALNQLKSSLRDAGLSRTSAPKDAKKRNKQRKQLSSGSQAHRSAKLDTIGKEFNRFDVREENKKFEVVTRQGKPEAARTGAPGKSRAAGIELRKRTLLPQLEQRNHTSTFLDRRFGENSTTLTPEEKALERFTAERTSRLGKKGRFNLEDGDDGEESLTHGGQKLGFGDEDELDAGGWGGLGAGVEAGASNSNREPLLRRRMAAEAEAEEEPPRKRSRAEIMDEVVAKSKAYKAERQKAKSADDESRLALDAELKDLRLMLGGGGSIPRPANAPSGKEEEEDEDDEEDAGLDDGDEDSDGDEEDGSDDDAEELDDEGLEAALAAAGKTGVDRDLLRKLIGNLADDDDGSEDEVEPESTPSTTSFHPVINNDSGERPAPAIEPKDDDPYDSYVRLLALEPRATPTNRLKTPLELAQDAAKELQEREESRLRRERGEEDPDEKDGDGKKRKRKPEADDLEDDFLREELGSEAGEDEIDDTGLGKGLEGGFGAQVIEDHSDEEESGDEESGSGEEGSEDEFEGIADEIVASDDEEVEGAQESLVSTVVVEQPKSRTWGGKDVKPELPFTFPCPSTHSEFVNLLSKSGIAEADTATVVKRIRVLYHPGLGEANKGKLQVFTNVLLDHVLHLASSNTPTAFATINSLLPNLLTLSHAFPLTTAPYYVEKLALMQKNFMRGVARGPLDPSSRTWPGPAELTLLRLVGMVWSTSDLSHPVAAGAMLLIGQYLAQSRVRSLGDIAAGLFLCTLAAQYELLSKRLVPEAMNFLSNSLLLLLPTSIKDAKSAPGSFPVPDLGQDHVKALRMRTSENLEPSKLNLMESLGGASSNTQLKVNLVASSLALLQDFAEKYVSMDSFMELLKPTSVILDKVNSGKIPASIKTRITSLQTSLDRMIKLSSSSRKPLILQHHKPIPIATYIPKFDEGYNPNRKFDPDTERAEANKTRALYKKEKKGAIRELRKDNKFLAGEEQKIKAVKDAAYTQKIAKIMGGLQDERAEEKAFEAGRAKGKRQDKARRK